MVEGGDEMVADETSEDRVVTGPRRRSSSGASDCGSVSLVPPTSSSNWPSAVHRCRATTFGLRHARERGCRCTASTAVTPTTCAPSRTLDSRRVGTQRQELVPGGYTNRGPGPQSAAIRHHVPYRTSTSTSCLQALNTSKDRICRAKFTFETADPTHLDHVLRAVRGVPAVYEAYRIHQ